MSAPRTVLEKLRDDIRELPVVEKIDLARVLFCAGRYALAVSVLRMAAEETERLSRE